MRLTVQPACEAWVRPAKMRGGEILAPVGGDTITGP